MKKLITIALTLIALTNVANAQQSLRSVSELSQDPTVYTETIYVRCSALFASVGNILKEDNFHDKDVIAKTYEAGALMFSHATDLFQQRYDGDRSFLEDLLLETAVEIGSFYLSDMNYNLKINGDYMKNMYVQEDMGICTLIFKEVVKNYS